MKKRRAKKNLAVTAVAGVLGLSLTVAYGGGSPPGHSAIVLDSVVTTASTPPTAPPLPPNPITPLPPTPPGIVPPPEINLLPPEEIDPPPELEDPFSDGVWFFIVNEAFQEFAKESIIQWLLPEPNPPASATFPAFVTWCEQQNSPPGYEGGLYYTEYFYFCDYIPVADGGLGAKPPAGFFPPAPPMDVNGNAAHFPPGATLPPIGPAPFPATPNPVITGAAGSAGGKVASPPAGLKLNLPPGIGNVGKGAQGAAPASGTPSGNPVISGAAGNVGNGAQGVAPAPSATGIPPAAKGVWTEVPNTELSVMSSAWATIISDLVPNSAFPQQISELQQLETIPFSGGLSEDTPAQQAEAQADLAALNTFFGTAGIEPMGVTPAPAATPTATATATPTATAPADPPSTAPTDPPSTAPAVQNPVIINPAPTATATPAGTN